MNRLIKFRAMLSDEYVKKMTNPAKIWNYSGDYSMTESFSKNEMRGMPEFFQAMDYGHYDRKTLSQFTGLVDKKGREIYEGDIVRLDSWEPNTYKIDFDRGAFYIAKGDREEVGDIKYAEGSVVIGNIYENPELLNHDK